MIATFMRFGRPHTIIATSIQVITMFLIIGGWQLRGFAPFMSLAATLISCLAVNIYVVGLNQITDIAIDRINKPKLPLAAGQLSLRAGWWITVVAGLLSLGLALISGPYLLLTILAIMLIGSAYSLPPLRLKRFSIWAALSIALARGLLANIGIGLHYQMIFGMPLPLTTVTMLGLFFFGFGLVIAIYKDIPDLAGDQLHRIQTLTVRLGPQRALALGRLVLTACYGLPIAVAIANLPHFGAIFLLISHVLLITLFWQVSIRVNLERHRSIASFYMFLWCMFYTEFLLLSVYEITRISV